MLPYEQDAYTSLWPLGKLDLVISRAGQNASPQSENGICSITDSSSESRLHGLFEALTRPCVGLVAMDAGLSKRGELAGFNRIAAMVGAGLLLKVSLTLGWPWLVSLSSLQVACGTRLWAHALVHFEYHRGH